ncbi:MAG: pyridoxal phosphate-dependent aminotransferase [Proteobacteria bacterium]|nr:pyridoxal phosphate-dependent aminotransferase [Pseudomonadota bacterium]MCP4916436.1 pyridoxal phosphate-dependent aminotransferase [Pseudomonadota bacterium]
MSIVDLLTEATRRHKQPALRSVSRRIEARGGINLSQGKCPLPLHPIVQDALQEAARETVHSATLRDGHPRLRRVIAERFSSETGVGTDPDQVCVSGGATGTIECICRAFLEAGDEVVLFRPAFPYYTRMVRGQGATPVFVDYEGDGSLDAEKLAAAFSARTKLVIFCSPSNPTGRVRTRADLELIAAQCLEHDVVAVSDDVYMDFCRDEHPHQAMASLPGMASRTLSVRSTSKTLKATGWRIGWVVGPAEVISPISVKSDQLFLCASAPLQVATALALERLPASYYTELKRPFHRRMDQLAAGLSAVGFQPQPSEGGYFLLARYEGLGFASDDGATNALIERCDIGPVPGHAFHPDGEDMGFLRFSCAVPDPWIYQACEQLKRL